jgi:hypothetical protein
MIRKFPFQAANFRACHSRRGFIFLAAPTGNDAAPRTFLQSKCRRL